MAGSTTTTLNDLLPKIIQEAMFVASERSIMRGLVKNYTLSAGQGKTVNVPIYPKQTAYKVGDAGWSAEGDEVPNTAVSTNEAVLTISPVAIRTVLTDFARVASASNVVADLGRLFGEAVARRMDQDLTATFSSFTAPTAGTTLITAAQVFTAVAKLKADAVPTDGMVCVVHPEIAFDLKSALTTPNSSVPFSAFGLGDVANQAMREGFIGMLSGIPVYETSNIANSGSAGNYLGAIFQRDALGLGMIGDISIETQRRAELLGDDIVCSAYYGTGVLMADYGRSLNNNSSINP
jgi:N4-gp56 family major capsid protein